MTSIKSLFPFCGPTFLSFLLFYSAAHARRYSLSLSLSTHSCTTKNLFSAPSSHTHPFIQSDSLLRFSADTSTFHSKPLSLHFSLQQDMDMEGKGSEVKRCKGSNHSLISFILLLT
ncbi:MAG: hypothetical protein J3R72DRAFT_133894 [Linnemannia gamsii]|nr:MAG: hypothetical protein J3R72DRAFT_133894 [Linnemannia gamsii]